MDAGYNFHGQNIQALRSKESSKRFALYPLNERVPSCALLFFLGILALTVGIAVFTFLSSTPMIPKPIKQTLEAGSVDAENTISAAGTEIAIEANSHPIASLPNFDLLSIIIYALVYGTATFLVIRIIVKATIQAIKAKASKSMKKDDLKTKE